MRQTDTPTDRWNIAFYIRLRSSKPNNNRSLRSFKRKYECPAPEFGGSLRSFCWAPNPCRGATPRLPWAEPTATTSKKLLLLLQANSEHAALNESSIYCFTLPTRPGDKCNDRPLPLPLARSRSLRAHRVQDLEGQVLAQRVHRHNEVRRVPLHGLLEAPEVLEGEHLAVQVPRRGEPRILVHRPPHQGILGRVLFVAWWGFGRGGRGGGRAGVGQEREGRRVRRTKLMKIAAARTLPRRIPWPHHITSHHIDGPSAVY